MLPTIGRIVHHRLDDPKAHRGVEFAPGVVTNVIDDKTVELTLFLPKGGFLSVTSKQYSDPTVTDVENINPGTWCWPNTSPTRPAKQGKQKENSDDGNKAGGTGEAARTGDGEVSQV